MQTLNLVKFIKKYNSYVIRPEEMEVLYPSLLKALKTNTTITILNLGYCGDKIYNGIRNNMNLLA